MSFAAEAQNKAELDFLAQQMSHNMKAATGERYAFGEGAAKLYTASGNSPDWAHLNGIMITYTVELRDRGVHGFLLPPSMILPMCKENIEGLRAVYEYIKPHRSCNKSECHTTSKCVYNPKHNTVDCICKNGYFREGSLCKKGDLLVISSEWFFRL